MNNNKKQNVKTIWIYNVHTVHLISSKLKNKKPEIVKNIGRFNRHKEPCKK